jgi:tetratricopeptide (TPR) repeat protein
MNRAVIIAATIPVVLGRAPAPTLAQEESPTPPARSKAERISDRALASLLAWRVPPAENLLSKNEKTLSATPEYKTALGYLRAIQGNAEQGIALLQDAAKAKPDDPAPKYYLGEVQHWRQKPDAATSAWKAARGLAKTLVDANAEDAYAQFYLGAAQVRLKQFGAARSALEAARKTGVDPALIDYQLGLSYVFEENWQDAVTAFDAVAARDARFAHLYFYRGLAWDKLDRKDKMLNDWSSFVGLAPTAPESAIAQTMLAAAKR